MSSQRAAIHHASRMVKCGSLAAIFGANGSGKSILKANTAVLRSISGGCAATFRIDARRRKKMHANQDSSEDTQNRWSS